MKKQELMSLCRDENDIHDCGLCPYEFTDTCCLRLEEIEKEQKFREIEGLVEFIANKKQWDCYEILNLDVILDDGELVLADITVFYRDKNDFDEVLTSKFNKITQKDLLKNAIIY